MKHYANKKRMLKLNPVAASILLLLPVIAQADISIINGNVTSANGVPVVNIKEANSKGLSHNVYETLNVGKEGVIFNNSASAVQTTLAGQIEGNANLAGGTAKVILNEVTSKNASTINGMMEVAGDSAHLIIANPNGITTQGGGFINAEKGTLTTGTPNVKDGALTGYTVKGGSITVGNFQSESPTEILARSVKVNGSLRVDELSVIAGNNVIDVDGSITGTVEAIDKAASYGVDVSKLGGMYANRINLISTEGGVGVRNEGTIAGGASGLNITSNGKLINNSAMIQSSGDIAVNTNGALDNINGKINSGRSITIDTAKSSINNTTGGNISAASDINILSGALDNANGKIASGGMLTVNTNNNKLNNSGRSKNAGIEAAIVLIESGELSNSNGQIHGNYINLKNSSMANNSGVIDADGNVEINSTGNIENITGLIRSSAANVKITTTKAVKNNNNKSLDPAGAEAKGIISGSGTDISADYVFNNAGTIASAGDIKLKTTRDIDNYQGKIESSQNISIEGRELRTSQAGINGIKGVNIELSDKFDSRLAMVTSTEGDVSIKANKIINDSSLILAKNINVESGSYLDSKYSMMVSDENLTLKAEGDINVSSSNMFGYYAGQYFGYINQEGGIIAGKDLNITAKNVNNTSGRIVSQSGDTNVNLSGNLTNNKGQVVANSGNMNIDAKHVAADYSTIYSAGNMNINVDSLSLEGNGSIAKNTATGIISSDRDIFINVNGDYFNNGWISGKGDVTVKSTGYLRNSHTINADGNLNVSGYTIANNKDIVSGKALTITTNTDLTNNANGNITGYTTRVDANNVSNMGNLVASSQLNLNAANNIYNYFNIYTEGKAVINAKKVINTGFWAVFGGAQGLQTAANITNIFGTVVGK
ncbi:TPA: filamentous hemagglutinin N-terminal domain-containing protein [Klebsiella oxytoca]